MFCDYDAERVVPMLTRMPEITALRLDINRSVLFSKNLHKTIAEIETRPEYCTGRRSNGPCICGLRKLTGLATKNEEILYGNKIDCSHSDVDTADFDVLVIGNKFFFF